MGPAFSQVHVADVPAYFEQDKEFNQALSNIISKESLTGRYDAGEDGMETV